MYKVVSVFNVGMVVKVEFFILFVKILVSIILLLLIELELDEKIKNCLERKYVKYKLLVISLRNIGCF